MTASLPVRTSAPGRWIDLAAIGITALLLGLLARDLALLLPDLDPDKVAVDYRLYVEATERWLGGGGYYLPHQLAGPYEATPGVVLFPPPFLLVMLPFLVLPWPAYWLLPVAAIALSVWRLRPRPLAWPGIALALWWPGTTVTVVAGNPVLLFTGALALGTLWAWPAVLGFLKPSLLPFAFFGAWRRSWWLALLGLAAVSVPFAGMWLDYGAVLLNARHPLGLLYNLGQVPTLLLPVIAWAGRRPDRGIPGPRLGSGVLANRRARSAPLGGGGGR